MGSYHFQRLMYFYFKERSFVLVNIVWSRKKNFNKWKYIAAIKKKNFNLPNILVISKQRIFAT